MKVIYLLVGLLIGSVFGVMIGRSFDKNEDVSIKRNETEISETSKWTFPDSLDAIKMAPESHKIVFEDSIVRILQVILEPNETEPMHTHQWKSVMWFTNAASMTYYQWDLDNNQFFIKDSISIPQMPREILNQGEFLDAEGPHAIRNLENHQAMAYRVEFK